ncbi:hypothetical protein F511_42961 [Dorcoceras hygrometricum]|uniref:Uncharacterized protein n=1 Tax=Dorcoceras hygrometricum TaxID=472368 RepID=A0A2Z7C0L7_9LAMI|nr:hypothetical protein F511_42961 [Dorcoceras hygrometricum]
MSFRVVRTNQYNQDLRLIHSTNGNHLKSPNEGSSIDHQFPSKHDDVKLVYVVSHTVEAVVHLWSLGVLTAAGCGIGSVHKLKSAGTSLKRNQQVATVLPGVSYNEPAVATHPVVGKSSRKLQYYFISSRLGTQTQEKKKQAKCRDSTSRELQNPVARKEDVAKLCNQAQSFQSTKISAEYEFSRSDKSAAKQLTIYEELSKLDVNC